MNTCSSPIISYITLCGLVLATLSACSGDNTLPGSDSSEEGSNSSSETSDPTSSEEAGGEMGETTETNDSSTSDDPTDPTEGDDEGETPDNCGDGEVNGTETCDDGVNDGSYGGCEPGCSDFGPYCGDTQVNGPELCDDGENDDIDDGCLPGCDAPADCQSILNVYSMAPDGEYLVWPPGESEPVAVACDMSTGGWILAMRFAPSNSTFSFYSPFWTEPSLLNPEDLDPESPEDGKFPAFNLVPAQEIRGCMKNPNDDQFHCKGYALPDTVSLLGLFSSVPVGSDTEMKGLFFMEPKNAQLEWLTIQGHTLDDTSAVIDYTAVGINVDDDQSCYDAKVRFGLVLNNEDDIYTLNDAAGFGAQSYYSAACDLEGADSLWETAAGFASGENIYSKAGQIWVR